MPVFVDTGAFVALLVGRDVHHARARDAYNKIRGRTTLITSVDVFDETITRLRRKTGYAQAVQAGRTFREEPDLKIMQLTEADRDAAWTIFEQFGEDVKSLTDCTSAALMQRLGIDTVFTFDRDFHRFGMIVIP